MGSASSKDHDPNPHDLGGNFESAGPSAASPYTTLHRHPDYENTEGYASPSMSSDSKRGNAPGDPQDDVIMGVEGQPPGERESAPGTDAPISCVGSTTPNDVVPMVFRWDHGGHEVYITGTFNNWSKQCPMHRSGNDFTYVANLTRGKHAYKFVVDEEWRFAPDQLTVADVDGNVNNFVDVSDFEPMRDYDYLDEKKDDDNYGSQIPDIDEYTKEPPPLPPHLRHIILNKNPPSVDTRLLPVPQHVALNHLYCTAIKDGMMVLGLTQRYKQKFVTTVYYSLMPGTA